MPWRRKSKGVDWGDVPGDVSLGDDPISLIIGVVLMMLIIPLVVLAVLVTLEMLLLLLLLPFAILGRMLLGRHWRVEVREGWTFAWEAEAGDWAQSGRAIERIAEGLRQGTPPWRAAHPSPRHGLPRGQPPAPT